MADVLYFQDDDGTEPVADYLDALSANGRAGEVASILHYVDLLEQYGHRLRMPFSQRIDPDGPIWELRPGNHRIAYAAHQGRFVLLHAWRKRGQKLDPRALRMARQRLDDWRRRNP